MHEQNTKGTIAVKQSFSVAVDFHKTYTSISSAFTTLMFEILS